MKLKVKDNVIITKGKDRGKIGRIDKIFRLENKAVVKGINIVKKHQKKSQNKPQGGIIDKYLPINVSKVQIICPSCNRPTKIGYLLSKNTKTRICRFCRSSLDDSINPSVNTNESQKSER